MSNSPALEAAKFYMKLYEKALYTLLEEFHGVYVVKPGTNEGFAIIKHGEGLYISGTDVEGITDGQHFHMPDFTPEIEQDALDTTK